MSASTNKILLEGNLFKKGQFDAVYHLVANSDIKQSSLNTKLDLDLNFMTTYNVLETMRRNDVKEISTQE